jgi:hypothetical protein
MELRDRVAAQRGRITAAWIARKNAELEGATGEAIDAKDLDRP